MTTTPNNDLAALAARMQEAQAKEQRELLEAAWCAVFGEPVSRELLIISMLDPHYHRLIKMLDAEAYESAALMLVPDGWLVMAINAGCNNPTAPDFNKATALICEGTPEAIGDAEPIEASTTALAIASAALLAHVENSHE